MLGTRLQMRGYCIYKNKRSFKAVTSNFEQAGAFTKGGDCPLAHRKGLLFLGHGTDHPHRHHSNRSAAGQLHVLEASSTDNGVSASVASDIGACATLFHSPLPINLPVPPFPSIWLATHKKVRRR